MLLTVNLVSETFHYTAVNSAESALSPFSLTEPQLPLQNMILCRSSRCLYLVDADREKLVHRLQKAPDRIFTETLTTFSGAGFTPDDRLVVAARHTHLFVWNTGSGQPVRVLQAALSPVVKLFMSPATNKAVTLIRDNTLQVGGGLGCVCVCVCVCYTSVCVLPG